MSKKFFLVIFVYAFVAVAIVVTYGSWDAHRRQKISEKSEDDDFWQCVEAGYGVMESYPRKCITPEGDMFVEDIGNELEKVGSIRLENPRPSQVITSPLNIKGEAVGCWFFEGDFPIELLDNNGVVAAEGYLRTEEDWMVSHFIPFKGELVFEVPGTKWGRLILKKDNASGLPENDDALEIPVRFR